MESTKPSAVPGALLSDADLSILGQVPGRYHVYVRDVRLDYAHERWEFSMGMDGWHDQWSMTLYWDRL